jgi:hypothetical protein
LRREAKPPDRLVGSPHTTQMSKIGAIFFFLILIVAAFGLVSFASDFVFGRPITDFIKDFFFIVFRRQ